MNIINDKTIEHSTAKYWCIFSDKKFVNFLDGLVKESVSLTALAGNLYFLTSSTVSVFPSYSASININGLLSILLLFLFKYIKLVQNNTITIQVENPAYIDKTFSPIILNTIASSEEIITRKLKTKTQ